MKNRHNIDMNEENETLPENDKNVVEGSFEELLDSDDEFATDEDSTDEELFDGDALSYESDDLGGDLDIDAALASVGSLEAELAERDELERIEREQIEAERRAVEEEAERRATHYFSRPPLMSLSRGQMASVIPALLLMLIGAWLTFSLTTSDEPLETGLVGVVVVASIGLMLLVQWFTSDRWSRGIGFLGLALMFSSGILIFLSNNDQFNSDGYPLLIVGIGVAILLTQFLSQPIGINLTFIGFLFVLAGIIGLAVSTDLIASDEWYDLAEVIWLPLLIVVAILLLIPFVLRRERE